MALNMSAEMVIIRTLTYRWGRRAPVPEESKPVSDDKDPDFLEKGVVTNAETVGKVLMTGTGLAGMILLVKLTGAENFKLFDAEYPIVHAWFPFLLFTFAHWYAAALLLMAITKLKEKGTADLCHTAWQEVSASGNLFVRGAVAAMKPHPKYPNLYIRDPGDPAVVFTLVAVLGMMLAIIPFDLAFVLLGCKTFDWSQVWAAVLLTLGAVVFAAVNWLIGGNWLVQFAQLSKDHVLATTTNPAEPSAAADRGGM